MDSGQYPAVVPKPPLKPWHAIVGGVVILGLAQLTVGIVRARDAPPTLATNQDAIQVCRDETKPKLAGSGAARWTPADVIRDGDRSARVTGTVNGRRYTCDLRADDGGWTVIRAALD